jgi:hypothetical protein
MEGPSIHHLHEPALLYHFIVIGGQDTDAWLAAPADSCSYIGPREKRMKDVRSLLSKEAKQPNEDPRIELRSAAQRHDANTATPKLLAESSFALERTHHHIKSPRIQPRG